LERGKRGKPVAPNKTTEPQNGNHKIQRSATPQAASLAAEAREADGGSCLAPTEASNLKKAAFLFQCAGCAKKVRKAEPEAK